MSIMLATPLQDVTGTPLFAILDSNRVHIFVAGSAAAKEALDSFTMSEYCEIISDGRSDPSTKRLVINW